MGREPRGRRLQLKLRPLCSLSIVRNAKNPEKNTRDVFIGYVLVFFSYAIVGSLGYVGFMGEKFAFTYLMQFISLRP